MQRTFRIAAFASLLTIVVAACGSRVVPLSDAQSPGGGGPIDNPTATGVPTTIGTGTTANPTGVPTIPGIIGPGANPNCRGGATDRGVSATTIEVGLIAAKTGPFPGQFDPTVEAVDAYLKMINAAGGICGRKFHLTIRDDQGNGTNNKTAALELANEIK
ncbi:MAG: ABC transporter substrate-binding protein, partial [Actinomycetota bacterium]